MLLLFIIHICVFMSAPSLSAEAAQPPKTLRVLTANVGNSDMTNCIKYMYKLCLNEWEDRLKENIAKIAPDIAALQEVFDIKWCEGWVEKDSRKVCYKYEARAPLHQARRLLGDAYTIVCDGGANFECVGVKKEVGEVAQCPTGELCRGGEALRAPLPESCDNRASISAVDVTVGGEAFRLINGHPQATGNECRGAHVRALFEGAEGKSPLADPGLKVLLMGDMNLDPYRKVDDESIKTWTDHVGEGKPFRYLSGPAEKDPPYPTCAGRLLDHVVTNFAKGKCQTLGEAPGTARMDGVTVKGKMVTDSNDHRAILCEIELGK